MFAICVKRANEGTGATEFLEVGKAYQILKENSIGYYIRYGRISGDEGWVVKECLSVQKFRESQLEKIINDTSLEM